MTVNTTINKRTYSGNGSTTVFVWNFKLTTSAQMHVYIDDLEKAQGDAIYPWSLSGTIPGESGNVTFTGTPPPSGTNNVILQREMTFDQQVDYQPNDPFPAETHEGALDKLTMMTQETQNNLDEFDSDIQAAMEPYFVSLTGNQSIDGLKTLLKDLTILKAAPLIKLWETTNNSNIQGLFFYDISGILRAEVMRFTNNTFALACRNSSGVVQARLHITEAGKINIETGTFQLAGIDVDASAADLNRTVDGLNTKVIDIGDWDMNATPSVTVLHGVTYTKIRNMSALIVDDAGTNITNINYDTGSGAAAGSMSIASADTTSITLNRFAGELFDSINYDTTPYNRGWIVIQYTD